MYRPVWGLDVWDTDNPKASDNICIENTQQKLKCLDQDVAFLRAFGIGMPALQSAQIQAKKFSIPAAQALLSNAVISEHDYYCCLAFELGLEFAPKTITKSLPFFQIPDSQSRDRMARMVRVNSQSATELDPIHLAPDCRNLENIKQLLTQYPEMKSRLKITTLTENRNYIENRCAPSLLSSAINGLRDQFPSLSARRVFSVSQAVVLLLVLQVLLILTVTSGDWVLLVLHLTASWFYFGCIALRFYATITYKNPVPAADLSKQLADYSNDGGLPVYSILVALYKESGQVTDLVEALLNLNWPRERLEIKLVCEADDLETINVVKKVLQQQKTTIISLVIVPISLPKTKPKALNFALPLCRGRLLVIYDAEDRPHPMQLREAYNTFENGASELACLQAPLVIHNHHEGWLARLFAIEYSSLFGGLLPMLSKAKAPLPLGGTSNHFKRSILERIGAWDPYNVTEDADLGMRLARAGYQIGTITLPTYEEAPINFTVWLKQRTRWFKGWFQTWLVHMRHPIALFRDLGFWGTVTFHFMVTGMIVSALVHPLLLYFIGARLFEVYQNGLVITILQPLFLLDLSTIVLGYGTFAALAYVTLPIHGLSNLRSALWGTPIYWMLLSIAAWRALWHLIRRPHEWEKTPHRLRQNKTAT